MIHRLQLIQYLLLSYVLSGLPQILSVKYPAINHSNSWVLLVVIVLLAITTNWKRIKLPIIALLMGSVFVAFSILRETFHGDIDLFPPIDLTGRIVIYLLICCLAIRSESQLKSFVRIFSVISISVLSLAVVFVYTSRTFGIGKLDLERMGFDININTVAYLAIMFLTVSQWASTRFPGDSLLIMTKRVLLLMTPLVVFFTGSLGGLIFLCFPLIVEIRQKLSRIYIWGLVLIGASYCMFVLGSSHVPAIERVLAVDISSGRTETIEYAWSKVDDGFLLGVGYGELLPKRSGHPTTNHFYLLNILAAYGLIGLTLYLVFLFQTLIRPALICRNVHVFNLVLLTISVQFLAPAAQWNALTMFLCLRTNSSSPGMTRTTYLRPKSINTAHKNLNN